jgi:predicted  nucleic acid-binding Zn-ribbon protein
MVLIEKETRAMEETNRYKFFKLVDAIDANDKSIKIKQHESTYTLTDLENQKTSLTAQLSAVQEKIDAIKAL